ncbi:MAG: YeeE/YedE family protein [Proteobacteria bacterium]|nr:YeeE/YedE family protein [Pseudomonadota bacterium]
MYRNIAAFAVGLVFALGLGIAEMTQPARVIGFLDITASRAAWDPTLAFVMIGALAMYALAYRLALGRGVPVFSQILEIPTRRDIDRRLIGGAVLFGVGWGLSGFCPGPALTSLSAGNGAVAVFIAAMTAGMWLHGALDRTLVRTATAAGAAP